MKGEHKLLIHIVDKMSAFNDKLRLCITRVEKNKFTPFSKLNLILENENDDGVQEKAKEIVLTYFKAFSAISKNTASASQSVDLGFIP